MYFFEHHGMEEKEFFRYSSLHDISFPLHFHRAFELIIVEKGEMFITIEDKEYRLVENEAVFVFPNQLHKLQTTSKSTSKVIIFSPELIGHFYAAYKGFIPNDNKLLLNFIPVENQVADVYAQKSFLYSICDTCIKNTSFIPVKLSSKRKIIQNMLLFIDENFHSECTLKDVAKAIQYDYAYLSKLFYHYTNLTFTNYVNKYRITQAAYFLESTEDPISEIAAKCGYKTLRTFNRNFKEHKHLSPSEYRERNKEILESSR